MLIGKVDHFFPALCFALQHKSEPRSRGRPPMRGTPYSTRANNEPYLALYTHKSPTSRSLPSFPLPPLALSSASSAPCSGRKYHETADLYLSPPADWELAVTVMVLHLLLLVRHLYLPIAPHHRYCFNNDNAPGKHLKRYTHTVSTSSVIPFPSPNLRFTWWLGLPLGKERVHHLWRITTRRREGPHCHGNNKEEPMRFRISRT